MNNFMSLGVQKIAYFKITQSLYKINEYWHSALAALRSYAKLIKACYNIFKFIC